MPSYLCCCVFPICNIHWLNIWLNIGNTLWHNPQLQGSVRGSLRCQDETIQEEAEPWGCDSWHENNQVIGSMENLHEEDVELLFQGVVD